MGHGSKASNPLVDGDHPAHLRTDNPVGLVPDYDAHRDDRAELTRIVP